MASYAARSPAQYPINSPVEIRVTGLDDPNEVQISPKPESPSLSASGLDSTDAQRHWDIALWFDLLTIPQTPHSNEFYHDLEKWLVERFAGAAARTMPEWSKGWAYSADQGAWTDPGFLKHVREMLTVDGNWAFALETFAKYDKSHSVFGTVPRSAVPAGVIAGAGFGDMEKALVPESIRICGVARSNGTLRIYA